MGFFIYTKIMFKCDDELWNRVRAYKREKHLATLNDAMLELANMALELHETEMSKSVYLKIDHPLERTANTKT